MKILFKDGVFGSLFKSKNNLTADQIWEVERHLSGDYTEIDIIKRIDGIKAVSCMAFTMYEPNDYDLLYEIKTRRP